MWDTIHTIKLNIIGYTSTIFVADDDVLDTMKWHASRFFLFFGNFLFFGRLKNSSYTTRFTHTIYYIHYTYKYNLRTMLYGPEKRNHVTPATVKVFLIFFIRYFPFSFFQPHIIYIVTAVV